MGMTEFFVNVDEVWYTSADGLLPLREGSQVVGSLIEHIRSLYPKAYAALQDCYSKSAKNAPYFDFLCARRFCKCNFGALDHTKKDVDGEVYHFEHVPCPLRGECRWEGVICHPELSTSLSEAEKRVMRLVAEGKENAEIAEALYLSPNTVRAHIYASFVKVGVRNRAEFVRYAKENSLFV